MARGSADTHFQSQLNNRIIFIQLLTFITIHVESKTYVTKQYIVKVEKNIILKKIHVFMDI